MLPEVCHVLVLADVPPTPAPRGGRRIRRLDFYLWRSLHDAMETLLGVKVLARSDLLLSLRKLRRRKVDWDYRAGC